VIVVLVVSTALRSEATKRRSRRWGSVLSEGDVGERRWDFIEKRLVGKDGCRFDKEQERKELENTEIFGKDRSKSPSIPT